MANPHISREEVQAYLDAHNILCRYGEDDSKTPNMADQLRYRHGAWYYSYDGLVTECFKVLGDGTVLSWGDVNDSLPPDYWSAIGQGPADHPSLPHYFRELYMVTHGMLVKGGYAPEPKMYYRSEA